MYGFWCEHKFQLLWDKCPGVLLLVCIVVTCLVFKETKLFSRVALPFYIPSSNGTPLQYSCLENPMDRGAWWAAVHGIAKSRARLSNFTFSFHFHLFIYFWLHWIFVAVCGLSPVVASGCPSLAVVCGLLFLVASLVAKHGL